MNVREKLVELLNQIIDGGFKWSSHLYESGEQLNTDEIATHLIAHGVTVQECGHWIEKPSGAYGRWQSWCSSCGKHSGIGGIESNRHKPYCPNCGAKMMPQPPKGE